MPYRKSLIVALFSLIGGLPLSATSYYVSPSGNDFATGTSTALPWATVAKVNAADLRSGDEVYFKRGGVWREMLVPQVSGLTYGAYATGSTPIISGANKVSQILVQPNGAVWISAGTNVWSLYLPSFTPTQAWFNGVLGNQVPLTQTGSGHNYPATLGPNQWYYAQSYLYVYSKVSPGLPTAAAIEVTQRSYALLVNNVSSFKAEHLAFVNAANVNVLLGSAVTGLATFEEDIFSGALNEAISIASGSANLTSSEMINSGSGVSVYGGNGITVGGSLFSGNAYQAIKISSANGPSYLTSSTVTGNSTNSPATPTIINTSNYGLYASSSILLPNPFNPKIYNYVGLTDSGGNVYQSPYFTSRAAPLIVVPFVDDYINLAVAQAVSQVALSSGCTLNYALNTKLVTPQAWAAIAKMQASGVEIVAHTRSHSDLANNNVFSILYTGPAATATMSINQTTGLLQTFLNGSKTPDLSLPTSNTYNGVVDILSTIPASSPYTISIQPNQLYFTPINLAEVTNVDIKTGPFLTQAAPGYLTWEVEGAQQDIAANLSGYKAKAFATPFTSTNATVENHIQAAGLASNRNGTVNSDGSPDGNWLLSNVDVYNMGAEWLPFAFDATKSTSSTAALVEGLGAAGGVMAVYAHGYNEFTLQNWKDFFANLKNLNATCMTMSQANAYIESQGSLLPDGTLKNFTQGVTLAPNFAPTNQSPSQGASNLP